MGKLYVVSTPLGNLKDITVRGMEVLKEVQAILAEDSREARKLLQKFEINTPIHTYHQHSSDEVKLKIFQLLHEGQNLALVTDAGTPGISDPGNELISFLLRLDPELEVIPVPGPSALTALLSISGMNVKEFIFLGFFPKKKHTKLFSRLQLSEIPFVFFESPHRIKKTLKEVEVVFPESTVVVGRELTKLHETIYRGTVLQVIELLSKESHLKGELTVVVEPISSS